MSGKHAQPVDIVAWGVDTGRYSPARAQAWAAAVADERRRSGGSAAQTEAAIRSLHPVYAVPAPHTGAASPWIDDGSGHLVLASGLARRAPGGDTPLLDDLDRQLDGPTADERRRAEDLAAEAGLAEAVEAEREAAAGGLTAAEEAQLFGTAE